MADKSRSPYDVVEGDRMNSHLTRVTKLTVASVVQGRRRIQRAVF